MDLPYRLSCFSSHGERGWEHDLWSSFGTTTLTLGVFTLLQVCPLSQPLFEVQGSLPCFLLLCAMPGLGESEHVQMTRAGKG